jgi:signal transduction histidine kinase/ActR/RegA family two-component response regulator
MTPPLSTLQAVLTALHSAPDALSAAVALSEGLDAAGLPAVLALIRPGWSNIDVIAGRYTPPDALAEWLASPDAAWHGWRAPAVVAAGADVHGFDATESKHAPPAPVAPGTLFLPVGARTLYGVLVLVAEPPPTDAQVSSALLLCTVLAERLAAFEGERQLAGVVASTRERDNAVLVGMNALTRDIGRALERDALWQAVFQHFDLLFDTTSYYIGLYHPAEGRLALPLLVENGIQVEDVAHERPLSGLARAVVVNGAELLFEDLSEETARLDALHVTGDEDEPGGYAAAWMGVPLRGRHHEIIGLIALQNTQPGLYDDGDLSLLMTIASTLSIALETLRLAQAERERRELTNALLDMVQIVTTSNDYGEVLERLLEQMQRVCAYDSINVLLTTPDSDQAMPTFVFYAGSSTEILAGEDLRFNADEPIMQAYSERIPIGLNGPWRGRSMLPDDARWRSALIVPMAAQNRVIGVVTLARFITRPYTEADARAAFALARIGALAVELARLRAQWQASYQVQEERARRLASIHQMTGVITSSLQQSEVLNKAVRLLRDLYAVDHVGVVMFHRARGENELLPPDAPYGVVAAEYPESVTAGATLPFVDGPLMAELTAGQVVRIADFEQVGDETRSLLETIHSRGTMIAPMMVQDELIGSIGLDMMREARAFTDEEAETFRTIAAQVALAVRNAALYENAVEASRLKSEFLATISHELRTPLNAIIGYSEMLLAGTYGEMNDRQTDRIERVHHGGAALLALIDDVLDLSRIETGQIALNMAPARLSQIAREAVSHWQPQAHAKGLEMSITLGDDEPATEVDVAYFRRLLDHLLSNAVKFTHKGEIRVRIDPVRVQGGIAYNADGLPNPLITPPNRLRMAALRGGTLFDGAWIAVSVQDTGIGIAPENHEVIFEIFRQSDGSTVRRFGGAGTGLALSRQLAGLHRGLLWVNSAAGAGSTFIVLVPVPMREPKTSTADLQPLVMPIDDARPLLLLVDDDEAALRLVQDFIGDVYRVVTTQRSAGVPDMARTLRPDLIISDVMMPVMNGWDLLRALKDDEATAPIPVVIMSVIDQRRMGLYMGAADYLLKPASRELLLSTIARVLDAHPRPPGTGSGTAALSGTASGRILGI